MSTVYQNAEEVVRQGQNIYKLQIKSQLESEHRGKFPVLDIQTGQYEIDMEDLTASKRLAVGA